MRLWLIRNGKIADESAKVKIWYLCGWTREFEGIDLHAVNWDISG